MNRSDVCPDLEAWRLFHAADVSEEELERLAAHQEACAACRAVLASLDSLPELLSGRYKLLPEIGRGAMGVVYAARDVIFDRHVAVKVLSPEIQGRPNLARKFLEEAQRTSQ